MIQISPKCYFKCEKQPLAFKIINLDKKLFPFSGIYQPTW
jgi:hypothetical protein